MNTSTQSYSAAKGRSFAFTVATALTIIALIGWWRGRELLPVILGVIAAILVVAGLVAPAKLELIDSAWMALAHAISRVTTPIFMGIVYFLLLSPIGALRRAVGNNPLDRKPVNGSYWISRPQSDLVVRRKRMERQF